MLKHFDLQILTLKLRHFGLRLLMLKRFDLQIQTLKLIDLSLLMR